ncbi:alpha-protein kinase 1 [Pipra filicauda]|uniref:Alpha-protein kinase 1 n=1 Tax=Pipra filicauda TaxID=649802 RepID=A0A7R5L005_9PASS|nr:alpha-protein kinase 1 [Pipra filicauda]
MNNQNAVAALLQECERALDALLSAKAGTGEEDEREYRRCQALLPEDLRTLLEEAKEMKWPFVPEKWQYKQDLGPEDKTNLQDMISSRLPDLLVYLKASIVVRDCATASAVVFLIDRFLYWIDTSGKLLRIAKGLHRLHPGAPVSPQVLIRQARLAVNTGKLLKAEYILSSLINDNGATGTWRYAEGSDRTLVQAVCLQIRGQILQKLGMWYEAAELIWASLVGYFKLPQPDKKGIATSLGFMADIFASMNEQDYAHFKTNADIDLSFLQESGHRLLSAAEACKLAAAYSQYTPLFVLTAVNIRGMCLLSYSHSKDCPPEKREFYLSEAKESFEIGLLTKNDQSPITSKQELHSFIKAAFCLATVHRWLRGESRELREVGQLCREALGKLHSYSTSFPEEEEKGKLAKEIMSLITSVKKRLRVESFPNSDARSYVPDSYKGTVEKPTLQRETCFEKILARHSQHHLSVCQVFENTCRAHKMLGEIQVGPCITTLRTETKTTDTACTTQEIVQDGRGAAEILSLPTAGSSSERLGGWRNQDICSGVMKISLEEETEPLGMEISDENGGFSAGQNRSQSTTSESSWCRLSKSSYSSSWEELNSNSSRESPREGQQQEKGSAEERCCTTESDGNGQAMSLCPLPPRAWNPAPREPLHSFEGSPQPSSEGGAPRAGRRVEKMSLCGDELREGRHCGRRSPQKKAKGLSDAFPSLSTSYSLPTRLEEEEKSSSCAQLGCRTKDSGREGGGCRFERVHPGEPAGSTEDPSCETHPPQKGGNSALSMITEPKTGSSSSMHDWIRKSATVGDRPRQVPEVDTQAETIDDTEFDFLSAGDSVNSYPAASAPKHQAAPRVPTALPSQGKVSVSKHFDCATTEGDEEKSQDVVSSRGQSRSSLSSWIKSAQMPTSSPEVPFLTPGGSFALTPGRTEEEILDSRFLRDDDYKQLLAGVEHNWLVQRLMPTGIFRTKELRKAYSALLLKYSKKSGLWTGQETAVFIGGYLNVAKEGKQRSAFWIHLLHQEEILGRYVGKEYKEEKGLLHHFSDVERQMTAQYYVTEFNKRLYEQKIPTQIFYIPSAVLLILEDRTIKGCVSVEPYILGEFVKLSNNTKVVKNEYKATEYGLAYGHFCYEFSGGTDVVVDLQGWVTGNGKGLIYLTDPQIHSLNSRDVSRSNFGKRGIYYFFNDQHVECNEICRSLSLTRPSVELLA